MKRRSRRSFIRNGAERVKTDFDQTPAITTRDFRRVLEQQDFDAVIVATPDHWHALPRSWPARRARTSTSRSRCR